MKKSVILICLFILSIELLHAQGPYEDSTYFYTLFENDWSFIEFDPPEGNIWQVGVLPQKRYWTQHIRHSRQAKEIFI